MPIPTKRGTRTIKAWACEAYWIFVEDGVTLTGDLTVTIDGGTSFTAPAATFHADDADVTGTAGWRFYVAGQQCADPGSAHVLAVGTHTARWWDVDGAETHAGQGTIEITRN